MSITLFKPASLSGLLLLAFFVVTTPCAHALTVTKADLNAKITTYVEDQLKALNLLNKPGISWKITPTPPPNVPLELKQSQSWQDLTLEYQSILEQRFTPNPVVRLTITQPGGSKRLIGVPVSIQANARVWAAKKQIDPHAKLSPLMVQLQPADVSRALDQVLIETTPASELNQYEARVILRAGEWLDLRKIQKTPAVKRNSPVKLIIEPSPGMRVTINGIALEDGQIGQVIRVKRQKDNRQRHYLSGTVTGKGQVNVSQ
ncbi:MAG: flagellar basal body P-ring formation chaperone FlgA [Vampirovibrionales bacterium]|nr:flagellar basal body P-ring formation chaperone FlgA [Vampirovibrionales bacterium]